jgi:hypothetical protein
MSFNEFVKQVRQESPSRVRSTLAFIKSQGRMYLGFYSTMAEWRRGFLENLLQVSTLALMAGNYRIENYTTY